jgi:hypothetical protein
MQRRTALTTVERKGFGGSSFDSLTHAAMFRTYKPFNFGVKTAELFSSRIGEHLINKKFTYFTVAQKNVYTLPGGTDDYEWQLKGDADIDFRITELLVSPTSQPGKGGLTFKIALDRDWLHEPAIIKSQSSNAPLLTILGYPKQRSANSFEYEVELQTGDLNAWLPVEYLQPGKRFIRVSSAVTDELNGKYAPDQYGEMFKLQSFVGNFANKAEFTDKFIRMEIAAREQGRSMPKGMGYSVSGNVHNDGAVGVGYVYQQKFNTTNSGEAKVIEKGVFISQIEARLLERTEMDAEMNMEFGQLQKTKDRDSGRTKKIAPGWRQILERIF